MIVTQIRRSYVIFKMVIEHERFIKTKNENRYLAVLVPSWGANRWEKALFGVPSRPDAHTAVFGGETVEH